MSLRIPVRIQGHQVDGTAWEEMTLSENTSYGGVSLVVKHSLVHGQVLLLSLPLPKRFRRYDLTEHSYHVYGLIRHIAPTKDGSCVSVMFLGKNPPPGFAEKPEGVYLFASDHGAQKERRENQRLKIFLNLKLKRVSPESGPLEEQTVAENFSKRGARVPTSMPVAKGEIVIIEELGGTFHTQAEVRNIYIGKDNVPRLNLRFLDAEAPDRLLR